MRIFWCDPRLHRLALVGGGFRWFVFIVVWLLVSGCSSTTESSSEERDGTLLVARTVFDGHAFHQDQAILVVGDTIVAVGPADVLRDRAEKTVDLKNATLLPGFIDLHVHTGSFYDYEALAYEGVTAVRDLGSSENDLRFPDSAPLEVVAAGPIITVPGGYPIPEHGHTVAAPIHGPDDARAKVRQLAGKGAGVIKIAITKGFGEPWPVLSLEETKAIVEEAHSLELEVTAHVDDAAGARTALKAGVDEWAHIPCLEVPGSLLRAAGSSGVEVVATLHVLDGCSGSLPNARAFVDAGGSMLYGSDLGNPGIPFGIDVGELELMMRAGLSLEEVLASATSAAGEALGASPLGSLSADAPADLIAVAGDLSKDLRELEDPIFVMANGEIIVGSN